MENIEELMKQASEASINRIATNTVAIVNSIRTIGHDPDTNRHGDGEEVATGCAGRWGNHHFVLTAEHAINQKAQPSDLRIFWRESGKIERRSDADLRPKDIADGIPIRDPSAVIHRCKWEDLAVVAIDPREAGQYTEFFDIANEWIDPPEGEIVICSGFPLDRNVLVDKRMIGVREERTVALRPGLFSGRVLPQPTEQEQRFQITAYDPDRHYLVPYEHRDSKHPRGFSGAAMWWESDQKQLVWKPSFRFAGVCTNCYKKGTVEQVVKASVVRRFLEEAFGPA
jgi:hypothetical protein